MISNIWATYLDNKGLGAHQDTETGLKTRIRDIKQPTINSIVIVIWLET